MEIFGYEAISTKCEKCLPLALRILGITKEHVRMSRQDFSRFESQQGSPTKSHFVRSIRGLPIFLVIPMMNSLAGLMIT